MNEQQTRDLEKAAADSAIALERVAKMETSVASLRVEIKRDLEELGQALANLAGAIGKLTSDGTQKVARTPVPAFTVTKEDDGQRAEKAGEEGKSVHELLKQALQHPQRASSYLR
jgi:hypothetical protein